MGGTRKYVKDQQLNHLRAWREVAGFKQAQVESFFGWSHPKVSNIERNKHLINDEILISLASLYGCTVEQLLKEPPQERVQAGFVPFSESPRQRATATALINALAIVTTLLKETQEFKAETHAIHNDVVSQVEGLLVRIENTENQLLLAVDVISDSVKSAIEVAKTLDKSAMKIRKAVARNTSRAATPSPPQDDAS